MTAETVLLRKILKEHGSRPDLRIFRNESGLYWAGTVKGHTQAGHLILANPSRVKAGLAVGSADLIGILAGGQFVSLEVKTADGVVSKDQLAWLAMVQRFGGLAAVVRSVGEVDAVLGRPVARVK